MGKLDGKVAVITGGSSGMSLTKAKLFAEEGAHVFITGRRQDALDEAVALIGRNVTGTEKDFDALFNLNTRGTLFTVQKPLSLFNDGGSIIMTGLIVSVKGWPAYSVYVGSKAALRAFARVWLNKLKDRQIRVNILCPGQIATPIQDQMFDDETKRQFKVLIPRDKMAGLRRSRRWRCFSLPVTPAM